MNQFKCSKCGRRLEVSNIHACHNVKCPLCGTWSRAPSLDPEKQEPDDTEEVGGFGIVEFTKTVALIVLLLGISIGAISLFVSKPKNPETPGETANNGTKQIYSGEKTITTPDSSRKANGQAEIVTLPDSSLKANRKAEIVTQIQQLQLQKNRYETARDELVRQKAKVIQDGIKGTLEFADKAETDGGAILRGIFGGAVTGAASDEYDRRIAEVDRSIADYQGKITALWQEYHGLN